MTRHRPEPMAYRAGETVTAIAGLSRRARAAGVPEIYRVIGRPGRRVRVRAAADVDFAAPEGARGVTPA